MIFLFLSLSLCFSLSISLHLFPALEVCTTVVAHAQTGTEPPTLYCDIELSSQMFVRMCKMLC
jgi:hypothetical protein